jgi:hypothetical protein
MPSWSLLLTAEEKQIYYKIREKQLQDTISFLIKHNGLTCWIIKILLYKFFAAFITYFTVNRFRYLFTKSLLYKIRKKAEKQRKGLIL